MVIQHQTTITPHFIEVIDFLNNGLETLSRPMVRQGQPAPNGSLVSERLNVLLVQNYCDEYHHCAILVYYPSLPTHTRTSRVQNGAEK